jgi:hypothetical protein
VLINHGEQSFTARSQLVAMNGATPEDNGRSQDCRVRTGQAVMSSKGADPNSRDARVGTARNRLPHRQQPRRGGHHPATRGSVAFWIGWTVLAGACRSVPMRSGPWSELGACQLGSLIAVEDSVAQVFQPMTVTGGVVVELGDYGRDDSPLLASTSCGPRWLG